MRGDFLEWRDQIAKSSPRQSDYTIAVFARALAWALDRGKIPVNPLKRPGRVWKGSRAEKVWSDDDESSLLAVANPQMALAIKLALWTGQRQGDLLRLTWKAYDGHFIRLRPIEDRRSGDHSRRDTTEGSSGHDTPSVPVHRLNRARDSTGRIQLVQAQAAVKNVSPHCDGARMDAGKRAIHQYPPSNA
jgi:integrase